MLFNFYNKSIYKNIVVIYIGCVFIAFFICLMSPLKPLSTSVPAIDSSVFITIAKGVNNGLIPYSDFFDHKGPLLYFINLIGWIVGNTVGVWFIELLFMSISILFLFKTLELFMSNKYAFLGTFLGYLSIIPFFEQGNLTEEYALPFIFISLYIFTKYFINNLEFKNRSLIIIGMCFGGTVLLRPNMFAIWLVFVPLILYSYFLQKKINLIYRFILYFVIGAFIIIFPFIYYLIKNGAFNDFINQYFLFNSKYAKDTNSYIFVKNFIYTSFKGFTWISLFAPLYWVRKTQQKIRIFHYACFYSSLASILFISLSRSNFNHYSMPLVPLISLQIGLIVNHLSKLIHKSEKVILISLLFVFILQSSLRYFFIFKTVINDQSKIEIEEISRIIENNTNQKDTFIVLGNNCALYLYTDVKPTSKYIYQLPIVNISDSILKDFEEDIQKNKPKTIVLPLSLYSRLSIFEEVIKNPYLNYINNILENKYTKIAFTKNYFIYDKK